MNYFPKTYLPHHVSTEKLDQKVFFDIPSYNLQLGTHFLFLRKASGATILNARRQTRLPLSTVSGRTRMYSKSVQVAVARSIMVAIVGALKNMKKDWKSVLVMNFVQTAVHASSGRAILKKRRPTMTFTWWFSTQSSKVQVHLSVEGWY